MSTVKELFLSSDRAAVLAALYRRYEDQHNSHEAYEGAWDKIVAMEPTLSDLAWIDVELVKEHGEEAWPDVTGIQMGEPEGRFAVALMPWSEWLNLEVRIKSPEITKNEAVAYILYEMTYHGFDPETVAEFLDGLKDQAAEIDEFHESIEGLSEEERDEAFRKAGYVVFKPGDSLEDFLGKLKDDDDD